MSKAGQGAYSTDDEKEFDLLFRKTYSRVLAYLTKVSGQPEVAEDLAQNIYLQLWEKKTTLPKTENEILYYLFTIARRQFYQHTQKLLKEQQEQSGFAILHITEEESQTDNAKLFKEKEDIVASALEHMEKTKAKYFRLNKEHGLTYRQIAEQEGVSAKTVMRYVSSAAQIIRSKLTSLFFSLF